MALAAPFAPATASVEASEPRRRYLQLLTWAFTLFNSVRVLAYLPTAWAIAASGSSDQYSLATWIVWVGANATMALWLFEQNGRRMSKAIGVNACNACMCTLVTGLIVAGRLA